MARTKVQSGLFVGMNKGHIVTKPEKHPNTFKKDKSLRRGRIHKRVEAVREVITEITGLTPFQRKMLELIRTGEAKAEKKAVKMARKRVGSQKRALILREKMYKTIAAQKKK